MRSSQPPSSASPSSAMRSLSQKRAAGWPQYRPAPGSAVTARPDQAVLIRVDHGLDPVPQPELGQDPADVRLDRRLGNEEPLRYLAVRQPVRDQDQYLVLPLGEVIETRRRRSLPGRQHRRELVDEPPGGGWRYHGIAGVHRPDREQQLVGRDILQQEAAGPRLERGERVLIEVEGGEHENAGAVPGFPDPPGRGDRSEEHT